MVRLQVRLAAIEMRQHRSWGGQTTGVRVRWKRTTRWNRELSPVSRVELCWGFQRTPKQ